MRSAIAALALLMVVSPAASAQQASDAALRIVVVEGEDAVNIIQQKTAVAPVIEVRDRNNLPVPGATVTFSLGPGASFGGSSTLTVVTNAAGQATATGLTPTAAGAIQIQATATFQGQTAIATIAQSNVMTAAEVATTAGAGSGTGGGGSGGAAGTGAGAGGGGGLSGMTLGIIGAAAGGALVATQAGGGGGDSPSASTTVPGGSAGSSGPTTPGPAAPTPGPSSSAYAGTMDGTLTGTSTWSFVGEPGISCSITLRNQGTTSLRLQTAASGAITGTLEMNGQQIVSAANCGVAAGLIPNAPFAYSAPVEGSGNTIRFSQEFRDNQTIPGAGSYSLVASISFTATISGGTVTGSLTYNSSADFRGDGFSGRATWTGTIPINLR